MFICTNNYVVNALPKNYQYVPKVHLKIGVDKSFIESRNVGLNNSNVFVTTHPLKGIDWLVELWLELIHHKLPWVELHIYSKLLGRKGVLVFEDPYLGEMLQKVS